VPWGRYLISIKFLKTLHATVATRKVFVEWKSYLPIDRLVSSERVKLTSWIWVNGGGDWKWTPFQPPNSGCSQILVSVESICIQLQRKRTFTSILTITSVNKYEIYQMASWVEPFLTFNHKKQKVRNAKMNPRRNESLTTFPNASNHKMSEIHKLLNHKLLNQWTSSSLWYKIQSRDPLPSSKDADLEGIPKIDALRRIYFGDSLKIGV